VVVVSAPDLRELCTVHVEWTVFLEGRLEVEIPEPLPVYEEIRAVVLEKSEDGDCARVHPRHVHHASLGEMELHVLLLMWKRTTRITRRAQSARAVALSTTSSS